MRPRALVAACVIALPASAAAEPLDVLQLDAMVAWLDCAQRCELGPELDRFACLERCGESDAAWEKDGVAPVTANDRWLAELEIAHQESGREICYRDEGTVVVPAALCPGALCRQTRVCDAADCALPEDERDAACQPAVCAAMPQRSEADCADDDADGVPAWLEGHLDTSDEEPLTPCTDDSPCGFGGRCEYDVQLGAALCSQRSCGEAACTAFHLELVARDDQTALVHVWYDHSPVPARVLDLRIVYDRDALLLQDARPLPALTHFGKELAASHLSDGTLRLVVYDPDSRDPIETGPLVELVFQRRGAGAAVLAFAGDAAARTGAMAPEQEGVHDALTGDELWGEPVTIPGEAEVHEDRLLLWYGFESELTPEDYRNLPDAEALCARVADCANEPDEVQRAARLARLKALQRGTTSTSGELEGVVRGGVYLDGESDHLRLPVHFVEPLEAGGQSFSVGLWFHSEGNGANEEADSPQLLFAHVGPDERSRFGLLLQPLAEEGFDLSFFAGDLLAPEAMEQTLVSETIALRTWHHVGFSLDADLGEVALYFDGELTARHRFSSMQPPVICPGFAGGSDLVLHEEGDFLGGEVPDVLYLTPRRANLHGIERVNLDGRGAQPVVSDGRYSHRDVDVLPFLDRMVYASNASGAFEIWLARLDGSERRRITSGFGDTARGIFARRPRFAPDGSGIVFESNVFSVPDQHNHLGRGYQLYFLGYDPAANEVAVELASGGTASLLDYDARLADQSIGAHQITRAPGNHVNAWWLRGEGDAGVRGELVFDRSDERFANHTVYRVVLPSNLRDAAPEPMPGLSESGDETRLLAAHRRVQFGATAREVKRLLFDRGRVEYLPAEAFAVSAVEVGEEAVVTLAHIPGPQADRCWDTNRNHLPGERDGRDPLEDRNGDGQWNGEDCLPQDLRNLYIQFDPRIWAPRLNEVEVAGPLSDVNKEVELVEVETGGGSYLRFEVLSPFNALPIPAGVLARLRFDRRVPGQAEVSFAPAERHATSALFVDDLTDLDPPAPLVLGEELDSVEAATFSPDGSRLLLYGISKARPALLRTRDLLTTSGGERVLAAPTRLRGMVWASEARYFSCNWVGGYQHPSTRAMRWGLRGGVDDLKLFAGLRDADAFASEAARGLERLEVEGRDGAQDSLLPTCSFDHAECPPFHLCVQGRCEMRECDPANPYACAGAGGRCTLRPPAVEQERAGDAGFDWVCASDCSVDAQCFTAACQNGPCRYCDPGTLSCIECRDSVQDYGAFQIAGIEGCPDRNSFTCDEGACVTECYSFDDGQSTYLCDPTLEYCGQGRCLLLEWDWSDFAPASFGGLTETVYERIPGALRTTAIGETTAISIKAYGVADYQHAPELLVEARLVSSEDGSALYGGEWFRVGKVLVYNKTRLQAEAAPYLLHVPHPISDLRVRLIQPPYRNLNGGASGLGAARDAEFCLDDAPEDKSACVHRPPGSDLNVGYRVGLPLFERADACREHGRAGCPNTDDVLRPYLRGGHNAAIILEATVNGAAATIESNRVCSYEGTLDPIDGESGARRKLFYGDIQREQSGQRALFCARHPDACAAGTGLLDFTARSQGAYALLNCNFYDAQDALQRAMVDYIVPPYQQSFERGAVVENANGCRVEIDAVRSEHCYEWMGGDASIDPLNADIGLLGVLEMSLLRGSHAHDEGFTSVPLPSAPLTVQVHGLAGEGLRISNGVEALDVVGVGDVQVRFPAPVIQGRRFVVDIERQPLAGEPHYCETDGLERAMGKEGATVDVHCGPVYPLLGTTDGLAGDRAVLRLVTPRHISAAGRARSAGRFDLEVSANGALRFPPFLRPGQSYSVTVIEQPRVPTQRCTLTNAAGVVPSDRAPEVGLSCVEVRPRVLSGLVTGLEGEGLVLTNRATGETLALDANGSFDFRLRVSPGASYEVVVESSPTSPVQSCVVLGGSGVMPNEDVGSVVVECTTLPLYYVGVHVAALSGRGLQLRLNEAEVIDVPADGRYWFETGLLDGASFDVQVATQPSTPAQICGIAGHQGEIAGADFDMVTVICRIDPQSESYLVGGTVRGLLGEGLRLSLGRGAQRVFVDEDGRFVFGQPVPPGFDYEVEVDTQPSDPTQDCVVHRGEGRVRDRDITDVEVECSPSGSLTLRTNADLAGLHVKALLVDAATGELAGETVHNVRAPAGGGDVEIVAVGEALLGSPRRASLQNRAYLLYAWLNDDDSTDENGAPTFAPGDGALIRGFEVVDFEDVTLSLGAASFAPSVGVALNLTGAGIEAGDTVACFWTHPTGVRPALPIGEAVPLVGRAAARCDAQGECRGEGDAPLPPGDYDLTCWLDREGDLALSSGDLVAFAASVTADGSDFDITLNAQ